MYAAAIILFREILEIAIILSVIMAASRGVKGRGLWISIGLAGGIAGSAVVAYFTDTIANWVDGVGQELFNASILLVAVGMIGWTVVWMKQHARELVAKLKAIGAQVKDGDVPLAALATVISLCVWREGSEIVLFMYGIMSTSTEPLSLIIIGSLVGALSAAVIGTLLYFGLLRIPMKYFFTTTEWLLILLACGLSAQAAGYLISADVIPPLAQEVWNSSHILPEKNVFGQILHALLGYTDRPSGMQLMFYVGTMVGILGTMRVVNFMHSKPAKPV